MTIALDLIGQKFGRLTVVERSNKKQNRKSHWICTCECGVEKTIVGGDLRSGRTTSCGCYNIESAKNRNFIDLTGLKYQKLTVIGFSDNRNNKNFWHCKCDCGNLIECQTGNLISGNSYSCGCYLPEKLDIEALKYIGRKYGQLTILEQSGFTKRYGQVKIRQRRWLCKCDCGSLTIISASHLKHTYSCGCVNSIAEKVLAEYLTQNKIIFNKQKTFDGCKNKKLLRFDFWINNQFLVECQGKQHYQIVPYWGGQNGFLTIQKRDKIKLEFCEKNKIPLFYIKYNQNPVEEIKKLLAL
jgi:hypothetical protein